MPQHLTVRDFDLGCTLESGQFFRWDKADGVYRVTRGEFTFRVWQEGERLYYTDVPAAFIRYFFSLDHDLPAVACSIDRDPFMREVLRRYWGLRLLRQDPWECTAAFVTSIASNIPRITRNVEDMARAFGREVPCGGQVARQFPRPVQMGGERELRRLRLGFRARYLHDAARLAQAGLLDEIAGLPSHEARETLMVIPGVAEKVADCVLLFAYGHLGAFPVDTWIRKAMIRIYFGGRPTTDLRIRRFAEQYFGRYAGYAQQYLYMYARQNWEEIEGRGSFDRDSATAMPGINPRVAVPGVP
ncbi:MAG: 8-oxoguanine DNA glycosylase [Planctomycetes bacterium]|nr:8-oxoguanine DNA glycosylase [Planctomycetota bacterium]